MLFVYKWIPFLKALALESSSEVRKRGKQICFLKHFTIIELYENCQLKSIKRSFSNEYRPKKKEVVPENILTKIAYGILITAGSLLTIQFIMYRVPGVQERIRDWLRKWFLQYVFLSVA